MSMDFDQDAFYICTQAAPRCFIVQKAIQMDRGQIERVMRMREVGKENSNGTHNSAGNGAESKMHTHNQSDGHLTVSNGQAIAACTPPAPPLPHWFNEQCRRELVSADLCGPSLSELRMLPWEMFYTATPSVQPAHFPYSPPSLPQSSGLPSPSPPSPRPDIKAMLRAQLEYYFSRENLCTDRFLRCQMDAEQYVPISIIAGFRKIVQLTDDYGLIVQTLRESPNVEVDERGEKVRPLSKRCTVLIRQLGEEDADLVKDILSGGPRYLSLRFSPPSSWYATYDSEDSTQAAYLHLQHLTIRPNNLPICQMSSPVPPALEIPMMTCMPPPLLSPLPPPLMSPLQHHFSSPLHHNLPMEQQPEVYDLGKVLNSLGYFPRATYRPGNTVVRVDECIPSRLGRGGMSGGGGGYGINMQGEGYSMEREVRYGNPRPNGNERGGRERRGRGGRGRDGDNKRAAGNNWNNIREERYSGTPNPRSGRCNGMGDQGVLKRRDGVYGNEGGEPTGGRREGGNVVGDLKNVGRRREGGNNGLTGGDNGNAYGGSSRRSWGWHGGEPQGGNQHGGYGRGRGGGEKGYGNHGNAPPGAEMEREQATVSSGGDEKEKKEPFYEFEENSFPFLPVEEVKKEEIKVQPVKEEKKLSFSSVAAGKKENTTTISESQEEAPGKKEEQVANNKPSYAQSLHLQDH